MLCGENRTSCKDFRKGNLKERGYLKELNVDGLIMFLWILKTQGGREWTELIRSRIERSGGLL